MGLRAMAASSANDHGEHVGTRHDDTRRHRDLAGWQLRPDVQADDAIDTVEDARVDHRLGASGLLFRWLKGKTNHPRQLGPAFRQEAGELQCDRHVDVVAAGMHGARASRSKRHVRGFREGKAVHVGPHQHRASRPLSTDLGHHAGPGEAFRHFVDPERIQPLRNVVRGLNLFEAQLRRGVQLASMGDEVLRDGRVRLTHRGPCLRGHRNHSVKLNSMPRPLAEYQRNRDFSKTPEPKGTPEPSGQNRFVVQNHWATRLHYDFRLEMDGVLVSWAIPKGPTLNPAEKRLAAHVEDHPVSYYDFEGTIPKGEYGGGTVMIWDWGTYELEESTPAESLKRGEVKFRLNGVRLRGRYALVRTRSEKDWLLIKKKDEAADPNFDIEKFTPSVKTGRTKEEIEKGKDAVWSSRREEGEGGLIDLANAEKGPMPTSLDPMKAQLFEKAFDDEHWLFEVKWDGIRLVTFIDDGKVRLQTRAGRIVDDEYPQLQAITNLVSAREAILDGEIVALDEEGRPSFQLLQNRGKEEHPMQYVVFDIVDFDGQRLFKVPLEDRKRLLRDIVRDGGILKYSDHVLGQGQAFFKAAQQKRLEGIVAKLRDSPYQPGVRSSAWLKIKAHLQQEVVIGGFTAPRASRKYFGALIVGVYEDGKLVYTGHVGGGFDERTLAELYKLMKPLIVRQPPFSGTPPRGNEKPTWVKTVLLAEVKFAEWTRDGVMRQPVFLGLRDDIDPREVRREQPLKTEKETRRAKKTTAPAAPSRATTSITTRKPPPTVALKAVRAPARPSARTKTVPTRAKRASTPADIPDTPLSRAAAQIAKQFKTDIHGATAAELEALDGIPKEGDWQIGGRTVHLTNLDKLLFPEDRLSQRDPIRYYVQVAPGMSP